MKQWMRRFFAVLMMLCLLAGCTAWAEKALDGNGLTGLQEREKKPDVSSMADASMDNKSSAKATFEGGWLGVYDNNHLVTMAVCYIDDSIIAVSSDKLREYAARGRRWRCTTSWRKNRTACAWARRKIPSSGLSLMARMIFPACT